MNCQWQDRIALYAGGDLLESESAEVERHLIECPDCAQLADWMAADRERLQSRPPELAEIDFDAMRRELRGRIVRGRRIRRWAPVVAIAAALLVAVSIPSRTGHRMVRPVDPASQVAPVPVAGGLAKGPRPVPAVRKTDGRKRPSVLRSNVEMRLTTNDPNVVIILLPVTTENPNE